MANTVLKYPDGRTEERKVISYFEDESGLTASVFDMGHELNGNYQTQVSYLSPEGRFQNVVDEETWNRIKGLLVKGLHGQANDAYRPVPAEMLVTEDPSRELYLRPANFDSLVNNYQNYLSTLTTEQVIPEVETQTTTEEPENVISEVVPEENVSIENQTVDNTISEVPSEEVSNENVIENVPEEVTVVDTPAFEEEVVPDVSVINAVEAPTPEVVPFPTMDTQIVSEPENVITEVTPEITSVPEIPMESVAVETPVQEEPSVVDAPSIETPEISQEQVVTESLYNQYQDIVPEAIVAPEGFNNITPVIESTPLVEEPKTVEIPEVSTDTQVMPEAVVETVIEPSVPEIASIPEVQNVVEAPINNIAEPNSSVVSPVVDNRTMASPLNNEENNYSPVTNSYIQRADAIISQLNEKAGEYEKKFLDLQNEYNEKLASLKNAYENEIQEMKAEMQNALIEAHGINELSKQTFERTQSMVPIEDEPSLIRQA